jgi:ubiquinone/menaquinone biosynthesis C-methylase UbiE
MKQRLTEWIEGVDWPYHERQYDSVYRSTIALRDCLQKWNLIPDDEPRRVMDVCAGGGANIYHLSKLFPSAQFVGVEINPELVRFGNERFAIESCASCRLMVGDVYDLSSVGGEWPDIVMCLQTLFNLPEPEKVLGQLSLLKARHIVVSSLFYDGPINAEVRVRDFSFKTRAMPYKDCFYNVYSVDFIRQLFHQYGYRVDQVEPFRIDVDLPQPQSRGLGTYTRRLEGGDRLQFSGPLYLPWYFMLASRR